MKDPSVAAIPGIFQVQKILNVDLRLVAVGIRMDQLLWVKMTDFMKFGGTETGTQGTLRHQLLYFPSKTTDRTSKASNSLNKYIKNTRHSFKLLEDSMSTRKQTTNFLNRCPCKLDSQLGPTFSSQKDCFHQVDFILPLQALGTPSVPTRWKWKPLESRASLRHTVLTHVLSITVRDDRPQLINVFSQLAHLHQLGP